MLHFLFIYLLPREPGMSEMAGGSGLGEDRISKREGLYDAFGRKIPFISYPLYQSFLVSTPKVSTWMDTGSLTPIA